MPVRDIVFFFALSAVILPAAADDTIFDIQELATDGRIVSAELADFDGDQQKDLMLVQFEGLPPAEERRILVYLRTADGALPAAPTHSISLPRWSSVFDIADVKDIPGDELVVLRPDGVSILSLKSANGQQWHLPATGPSTIGAAGDERGFERFKLVYHDFGSAPVILVPQIGLLTLLSAEGATIAQIDIGRRANFVVSGDREPFSVESDIQLFFDFPKLSIGDVDGDGRTDIVAATRHELRVFLQQHAGFFKRMASARYSLGFLSDEDHMRGSGGVVTIARDIDNDGRLDLMITHGEGNFSSATTTTAIYRNRNGRWDIANPDDRFVNKGTLGSDTLIDIENDGRLELARVQLRFSLLEMIELLLTQKIDTEMTIHRLQENGHYGEKPWVSKKVSTGLNFDTFRARGFVPPAGLDLDADGYLDFITSAHGKGIEVFLGSARNPYSRRSAMQKFSSSGKINFADFDNDGFLDFVIYDPQQEAAPVRVGRNLGVLGK